MLFSLVSISAVTASDDINFNKSTLTDSNNDIKLDEINSQHMDSVNEDSALEAKKITTTQDTDSKCTTVDSTDKINKSKTKMATDEDLNINTKESQKNTFEDLDDKKIAASTDNVTSDIITLNDGNKQSKSSIGTNINETIENLETNINAALTKIKIINENLIADKLTELNNTLIDLKNNIETTISEAKEKYKTPYEKKMISFLESFSEEINKNITKIQNNISNAKGNFDEFKTDLQNRLKQFIKDVNAGIKFIKDVKKTIEPLFKNNKSKSSASKTKNKITLTLKNIKTLSKNAKKVVITAKLKINGKIAKNKKVTFIFKGKKYVKKTNKKGIAKLTLKKAKIKKLLKKIKVGKKVTYQVKYNKKSVKKSFKVKK